MKNINLPKMGVSIVNPENNHILMEENIMKNRDIAKKILDQIDQATLLILRIVQQDYALMSKMKRLLI